MLKQYDELVQEVLEDIFVITRSEDEKLNQVIKKYFHFDIKNNFY